MENVTQGEWDLLDALIHNEYQPITNTDTPTDPEQVVGQQVWTDCLETKTITGLRKSGLIASCNKKGFTDSQEVIFKGEDEGTIWLTKLGWDAWQSLR